ncbi:MAG: hypothetical protein QOJ65_1154 [Fimbriimonadaceae bacterium]|jgi:predicted metalloprotease with PDZ domain|nr:hypothetical protein [Fimbriimonadaceae bacterium]
MYSMVGLAPLLAFALVSQSARDPILLQVNATDMPRNLIHVVESIPVKPGPFLLRYPKWIPGNHAPSGPINNVINFHVLANGREIPWARDPVELFDIRVTVPAGVNRIQVVFQDAEQPGGSMTSRLGRLSWNRVIFAPRGLATDIMVKATVKPPAGWQVLTALPVENKGDVVEFKVASLERLIDSPLQMGLNAKVIEVAPGHTLDMLGDDPDNLEIKPETVQGMKNLVAEARELWGARHYREYHWLLTFSGFGAYAGLEHHESSEDGMGADTLKTPEGLDGFGDLVSHEYTHSWNGKYRRPADLWAPDYATPHRGTLLWVYEGMTQYWGYVLPTRSGLWTVDHLKEIFARDTASLAARSGRTWRSVADTATSSSLVRNGGPWGQARRTQDYYIEGAVMWLGVDSTIRRLTNNKRSLDDFCRKFYGGEDTGPRVVTYTFDDIVATLDSVAPYDWETHLRRAMYDVHPAPPTEGVEAAGWRLIYNDKPTPGGRGGRRGGGGASYTHDLGISLDNDGVITDMGIGTPADEAGLAPSMKVLTVGDRPYSSETLTSAIKAAQLGSGPIVLQVQKDGLVSTVRINYRGGLRYPHLERMEGGPDYLAEIAKPKAKR